MCKLEDGGEHTREIAGVRTPPNSARPPGGARVSGRASAPAESDRAPAAVLRQPHLLTTPASAGQIHMSIVQSWWERRRAGDGRRTIGLGFRVGLRVESAVCGVGSTAVLCRVLQQLPQRKLFVPTQLTLTQSRCQSRTYLMVENTTGTSSRRTCW